MYVPSPQSSLSLGSQSQQLKVRLFIIVKFVLVFSVL
jgi:hypothetical protein